MRRVSALAPARGRLGSVLAAILASEQRFCAKRLNQRTTGEFVDMLQKRVQELARRDPKRRE